MANNDLLTIQLHVMNKDCIGELTERFCTFNYEVLNIQNMTCHVKDLYNVEIVNREYGIKDTITILSNVDFFKVILVCINHLIEKMNYTKKEAFNYFNIR